MADKLNSVIEFDDELIQDADFDIDDIIDEEEEMEEDNSVDMFDQDRRLYRRRCYWGRKIMLTT